MFAVHLVHQMKTVLVHCDAKIICSPSLHSPLTLTFLRSPGEELYRAVLMGQWDQHLHVVERKEA